MGEYSVGIATKDKILSCCKKLFYEKGIRETSYDDICAAAEVNRGLLPYYFKSKNNIGLLVFEQFIDGIEYCVSKKFNVEYNECEQFIIMQILLYRLLAQDQHLSSFYNEIETEHFFSSYTLQMQEKAIRRFINECKLKLSEAAFRSVVCMAEGLETEVIRSIDSGYLLESAEILVKRNYSFIYSQLGISKKTIDKWYEHSLKATDNCSLACNGEFECKFVLN